MPCSDSETKVEKEDLILEQTERRILWKTPGRDSRGLCIGEARKEGSRTAGHSEQPADK